MIHAKCKFPLEYCSPSSLSCFARCPARFYFSKCMRLEEDRTPLPLIYGKCLHAALHAAYDSPEEAFKIFLHFWDQENVEGDSMRNPIRAAAVLENFHFFHANARIYEPLDPPGGIIDSNEKYSDYEAPFLMDIGGKYPVYGKIDRRVKWMDNIWPLDYKTASQITDRTQANFDMCMQTGLYTLAMSMLEGTVLKGMIIESIRVSPKTEECVVKPIYVRDTWLDSIITQTVTLMEQIALCNEKQEWPQWITGCAGYGCYGTSTYKCEYFPLCEAGEAWEDEVKYFTKREFDPLKDVENVTPVKGKV